MITAKFSSLKPRDLVVTAFFAGLWLLALVFAALTLLNGVNLWQTIVSVGWV